MSWLCSFEWTKYQCILLCWAANDVGRDWAILLATAFELLPSITPWMAEEKLIKKCRLGVQMKSKEWLKACFESRWQNHSCSTSRNKRWTQWTCREIMLSVIFVDMLSWSKSWMSLQFLIEGSSCLEWLARSWDYITKLTVYSLT